MREREIHAEAHPDIDRAVWLEERRKGIGSSDAAALVGMSSYATPYSLWLEKTGRATIDRDTPAMEWGRRLEAIIAEKWADEHPLLEVRKPLTILRHPEHAWMLASLDRQVWDGDRFLAPLEIKSWSGYDRDAWADEQMPAYIYIQCQHQLAVTALDHLELAVLVGGSDYFERTVERDDEFIGALITVEQRFWTEHVLADVEPDIDGLPPTTAALKAAYPYDDGSVIELPDEALVKRAAYHQAVESLKKAEEARDEMANWFRAELGEHEAGMVDGEIVVTWKKNKVRTLRVKKEKAA